jgi:hypothetical protein
VLSYTLLPAVVADAFYSHFLFVLPGLRHAIYGPGDVEGVHVTYRENDDGSFTPISATADDGFHHAVVLEPRDFVDDAGRLVFMTDVWSHQLGARGAVQIVRAGNTPLTCFEGETLQPIGEGVIRDFRLGSRDDAHRAGPAWGF